MEYILSILFIFLQSFLVIFAAATAAVVGAPPSWRRKRPKKPSPKLWQRQRPQKLLNFKKLTTSINNYFARRHYMKIKMQEALKLLQISTDLENSETEFRYLCQLGTCNYSYDIWPFNRVQTNN